jgi:molybdopterin/thiamine biosynthesis adenylyltransferase/rhodanese-related sulfurtransferase
VEVTAAHRRDAFEACQWIVDDVKRRVPIWKKEHYAEGDPGWINAEQPQTGDSFYSRQELLKEVDQERLSRARVLVIGAGGLGCAALEYLTAAGVGTITIVDGDPLEESNLHRQPLYDHAHIGRNKAELAAERLRRLNPFIALEAQPCRLTRTNAAEMVANHDLVLDCTDNFGAKFLLNDTCIAAEIPLVLASIYQFEGQLLIVQPGGPCLRCLWPEAPDEGCVGSCAEVGVLGVVPGLFGVLQASEALKLILSMGSPLREGKMLLFDLVSLGQQLVSIPLDPGCPGCGRGERDEPLEVDSADGLLIDIREDYEIAIEPLPNATVMPMSRFDLDALPKADRYVLVCAHGHRSAVLARHLREAGHPNFYSLAGGTSRLRR